MKKYLLISLFALSLAGCNQTFSPEEMIKKSFNPFKEYVVNDQKLAKLVEDGILLTEINDKGLDILKSSAHLISYTKIGTYGKGEVRIMGKFTPEGLEKVHNKNYLYRNVNDIINYTCTFEYSEKTGAYSWTSDYPYDK